MSIAKIRRRLALAILKKGKRKADSLLASARATRFRELEAIGIAEKEAFFQKMYPTQASRAKQLDGLAASYGAKTRGFEKKARRIIGRRLWLARKIRGKRKQGKLY